MVHADASNFAAGVSKKEAYEQVIEQMKALCEGQKNWVCNLANASSLLYHALLSLEPPSSRTNWCGFYVIDPRDSSQLILGPFQGKVACQTIKLGQGVCGTAASTSQTQLVPDVEKFPGHIACDSDSKSEIVVPIVQGRKVVAIIDIDCAELEGFSTEDQGYLEELAAVLAGACEF